MSTSTSRLRRLLVALVVAAIVGSAAGTALISSRSPAAAAPAAKRAAAQSVLVTRTTAGKDTLWLLSPAAGAATAAGTLPGVAGSVAVAPNGLNVAYLPQSGAPRVWFGYGPLAPRTISLASAGVKKVDSFTWITDDKLLVSGVTAGRYANPRRDRLFQVTISTGKVRSFRDLRGTEPDAAPGIGKVAYVKLTTVPSSNSTAPLIQESLKVLRLDRSGAGRTVAGERYRLYAEYRAMSHPKISPSGTWLLTGQTGSDVRVEYALRDITYGTPFLTAFFAAVQAEAGWDATGQRTAFGGTVDPVGGDACVWVYDVVTGAMTRTPRGLLPNTMITDLAWSVDGHIVAATGDHVYVMPGDNLAALTDVGEGRLPIWVQP